MRYFTPELFVRLNSTDDAVVDHAEKEWENAAKKYRQHLARISKKLPKSLVAFCKSVCLHDAVVKNEHNPAWTVYETADSGRHSWTTISVVHEFSEYNLFYLDPVEPTEFSPAVTSPVFSDRNVIWLYDELDYVKRGVLSHEVLFSNGKVMTVKFRGFKYAEIPLVCAPVVSGNGTTGRAG